MRKPEREHRLKGVNSKGVKRKRIQGQWSGTGEEGKGSKNSGSSEGSEDGGERLEYYLTGSS